MSGTLLFVHGTGAHHIDGQLSRLRDGLAAEPRLRDVQVRGVAWGGTVGPPDLDVTPALPPPAGSGLESAAESATPAEIAAAEWDLLQADPLLELRILAELFDPGPSSPDALDKRLDSLSSSLPDQAHVDRAALDRAIAAVRDAPETADAALAVGDAADPELCSAVARAIVATALNTAPDAPIARDGAARDALATLLVAALEPAPELTEGFADTMVRRVMRPLAERLATRMLVRRRAGWMDPSTDFVRDVAFYVRRGGAVRELIAAEAARAAPPVVLLGHSLGGIAAVDLLSGPDRPASVKLLVTAGSQAPYLYLMDALDTLRPGRPGAAFTPWLNVYDRSDLLAFCAARVFPGAVDEEVDAGVPFPGAHSAYWDQRRFYALLAHHWPV
ncbi:hypothetical protein [Catenuloplanes japonicus]|uniref:hypothetical protein n=1 Tax=Catenuloplanes japonicus TaxID=33876 RepID=UPI00068DB4D8|nr:hypothetical protein [Catenuloplanes japonicus]